MSDKVILGFLLKRDYQIKTIQQAVNHIQDLYADDISFQIYKKCQVFAPEQAYTFFIDWINDTPVKGKSIKNRWLNVGIMLNNCFALSNLTRHKIPDIESKVQKALETFLSRTDKAIVEAFPYFKDFMTKLKENVTEHEFKEDLTEYLHNAVTLAE